MTYVISVFAFLTTLVLIKIKFFPSKFDSKKFHIELLMENYYNALINQIYLHLDNKSIDKDKANLIDLYLKSQRNDLGLVIYNVASETFQRIGDNHIEYLKTVPLFIEIAWPATVHGAAAGIPFIDSYFKMLETNNLVSEMNSDERLELSKKLGLAG